ncbi:hypothetical protein [Paraliomyxa miuraensis]|uniref:hypothetical protein n=1 Tax=Paraliomyxa miuraensis TaxID=376150 RepID=UPI0022580661|nr:hypothetical protein [Paraliomyxa miuraensis]MCX4241438.1 hypothetical protein [Paraliomyxa miuraensis]
MSADDTSATETRPGGVLDPSWEVALRAGQAAEDEQGSVEGELAVIHLLRHARAPQPLDDAAFERLWDDVDASLAESAASTGWRGWLRRSQRLWLWGGSATLAAAAAAVLVVVWSGPGPQPGGGESLTGEQLATVSGHDELAATIEAQFAMLEPGARAEVDRSVDEGRSSLRGDLLTAAIHADGRTMGGAP